jgi:hypothetical protein
MELNSSLQLTCETFFSLERFPLYGSYGGLVFTAIKMNINASIGEREREAGLRHVEYAIPCTSIANTGPGSDGGGTITGGITPAQRP